MRYYFERTFHPIGQGAFYSETHRIFGNNGQAFNVVYDCGTKKGVSWIEEYIRSKFASNNVDLLFLSHFHDDHYNGIEFLNPKRIVLPIIDIWDRVILWLSNMLGASGFDIDYRARIRRDLHDAEFIFVLPSGAEDPEAINQPIYIYNDADQRQLVRTIHSGIPIYLHSSCGYWMYIPINPKLDDKLMKKFKKLLYCEGIRHEEILKCDNQFFHDNHSKLKRIYRRIGRPNEYSMVVYSGPPPQYYRYLYTRHYRPYSFYPVDCERKFRCCYGYQPGCLYLGDIDLHEKQSLTSENEKPKSAILRYIYSKLPIDINNYLSTIQVPHHGSIKNFNKALFHCHNELDDLITLKRPIVYAISAGKDNQYGHPHSDVLKEILFSHNIPYIITEDELSRLRQGWILPWRIPTKNIHHLWLTC